MCVNSVVRLRRIAALAFVCLCCSSGWQMAQASSEGTAALPHQVPPLPSAEPSALAAPSDTEPASSSTEPSYTEPSYAEPVHSHKEPTPPHTDITPSSAAGAPSLRPAAYQAKHVPGSGGHLLNVVLALSLIVVLIVAVGWFVRRFGQGAMGANSHMQILAALPLGTRERLLLVDVAGQQLLLGVTATQINSLHVFSEPVVVPGTGAPVSEFGRKLRSLLQQKAGPQTPSPAQDTEQGKP